MIKNVNSCKALRTVYNKADTIRTQQMSDKHKMCQTTLTAVHALGVHLHLLTSDRRLKTGCFPLCRSAYYETMSWLSFTFLRAIPCLDDGSYCDHAYGAEEITSKIFYSTLQ